MLNGQSFQTDGTFEVSNSHHIVDVVLWVLLRTFYRFLSFEIAGQTSYLQNVAELLHSLSHLFLAFGSGDNNLSRLENEGSASRVTDTNNQGSEALDITL